MKKLQNNFTTPEQSKRLLELGVPADSADCYLLRTFTKGDTFIVEVLHDELYSKKDKFTNMLEYLPCWSVGRLIEICKICCIKEKIYKQIKERIDLYKSMIDGLTTEIEFEVIRGNMDFSKLEELV